MYSNKLLAVLLMCTAPLLAQVSITTGVAGPIGDQKEAQVDTSINDVYHQGSNELNGSITVSVNSDDFRHASPQNPIYLRLTPAVSSTLAQTLVDQSSSDPVLNRPIYLAMRADSGFPLVGSINATPEAVSIVRWVAGESEIWLCVQESSETWLTSSGPRGPSADLEISWTLGISARISDDGNLLGEEFNGSNLPFNTRNSAAVEGAFSDAVSTLICLNLESSVLTPDGTYASLVDFDVIAFSSEAHLGNGVFSSHVADNLGIDMTADNYIARGKARSCGFSYLTGDGTFTAGSLDTYTTDIALDMDCLSGGLYLDTEWSPGSIVRLRTLEPGAGFEANGARYTVSGQTAGSVVGNSDSVINVGGVDLFTEIDLVWEGSSLFNDINVNFEMEIKHDPSLAPRGLVEMDVMMANHTGAQDQAPYDGVDQWRRCGQSFFSFPTESFVFDFNGFNAALEQWPTATVLDLLNVLNGGSL